MLETHDQVSRGGEHRWMGRTHSRHRRMETNSNINTTIQLYTHLPLFWNDLWWFLTRWPKYEPPTYWLIGWQKPPTDWLAKTTYWLVGKHHLLIGWQTPPTFWLIGWQTPPTYRLIGWLAPPTYWLTCTAYLLVDSHHLLIGWLTPSTYWLTNCAQRSFCLTGYWTLMSHFHLRGQNRPASQFYLLPHYDFTFRSNLLSGYSILTLGQPVLALTPYC